MSDPNEQPRDLSDDLELDAETVTDLEPSPATAGVIRGGRCQVVGAATAAPSNTTN
jgi:hypothetical protein